MAQGTLQLNSYFGPYFLQKLIAVGGMAEIYLARAKGLAGFEKQLALKVIHPDYADDKTFIQMLVNEAKIAVGLNHRNITQTFDLGHIGNRYFISMEYVDGLDLFQVLRRLGERNQDLPVEGGVFVVQQMLHGLEYAHTKNDEQGNPMKIIHRDISPQNILCSRSGEVKIVDFGIAKAANMTSKTRAGVIKGKLVYMSPEQAWGDPVDHRTDVFSAGIVLYEALTCGSLYLEKNPVKLLEMVRKAEIRPPSSRRREVTPELDALVMKALSPRPADRYQSAREFALVLADYLHRAADFDEEQLGEMVDNALAGSQRELVGEGSLGNMARDDFAAHEHSIIFSADDMFSGAPLLSRPAPIGTGPGGVPRARVLLFENGEAKPFEVDEQFIIGRSGDLRLGDARVSRRHARIFRGQGHFSLEDLGSANGTYLNEEKVLQPTRLQTGDLIRVGPFEMRFVLDEAVTEEPERSRSSAPAARYEPAPAAHFEPEPTPLAPKLEEPATEQPVKPRPPVGPSPAPGLSAIDLTDRQERSAEEEVGVWLAVHFGPECLRLPAGDGMPLTHSLVLGATRVAGEAATLVRRPNGYWLEPLPNGQSLLLNGTPITGPTPVRPGDQIQVGPLRIDLE